MGDPHKHAEKFPGPHNNLAKSAQLRLFLLLLFDLWSGPVRRSVILFPFVNVWGRARIQDSGVDIFIF